MDIPTVFWILFKPVVDQKVINEVVMVAWALPEEQKIKALGRIYLLCHPDKNPDNPETSTEFECLKQKIEMAEGIESSSFKPQKFTGSYSSKSKWRGKTYGSIKVTDWNSWFNQWNEIASSHSKFQLKHTEMSTAKISNEWNIPVSRKDPDEAKRWLKQAKYDYATLCVLKNALKTDDKVSASACFMSNEVAEKSLKAGMYARCGLGQVSLANHNLVLPACQLSQLGCSVNTSDAEFLENFHLEARYPNCHPPPTVPGEKFTSNTAIEAIEAATRIYETIIQLIENND